MPRLFLLLALLAPLVVAPAAAQDAPSAQNEPSDVERPRNVILMIADGFGPASATLARGLYDEPLVLDDLLVGSVRTASTSSRVTDSAASATSYASGIRTYNGAIGVDTLQQPVGTILEAAEARGMATGLVATSRITHATPAAFAAHVPARAQENEIAAQLVSSGADVIFGGGRRFFIPQTAGGSRDDERDLLAEARADGMTVIESADALATTSAPVLGLFADDHLDYEIDRTDQPSLADLTRRALDLLSDDEDGFFLMVEGSRIDHAGHDNDPAGHVRDILAYDEAVAVALAFAEEHGETLVLSTADHETGGLTLGRDGVYAWHPDYLRRVRASTDRMGDLVAAGADPVMVLRDYAAIDSLTAEERSALGLVGETEPERVSTRTLADIVSRRALIGWTTGGHTGVDVGLYAAGPGADRFYGTHDNDAVGRLLADLLGLDLDAATARLRAGGDGTETSSR